MGKVIEFPDLSDNLEYVQDDDGKFIGVSDAAGVEITRCDDRMEFVSVYGEVACVPKLCMKELMIAWLALNYPDVIKWDED